MGNNNSLNEDELSKKIKLVSLIIMVGLFQITMLFLIVLGLYTGNAAKVPLYIVPFIVATLGFVIFMLIGFKKNRY